MSLVSYCTGPSLSHAENQDGLFLGGRSCTLAPSPEICDVPSGMLTVLDDMGGIAGGALATRRLLEMLGERDWQSKPECGVTRTFWQECAKRLLEEAESPGMGAAVAGLWLDGEEAVAFNCGDCRVYQYAEGELHKLTHDHSYVQKLNDEGIITAEQMRFCQGRNILLSAVSALPEPPEIFCKRVAVKGGDRFLLCTDGVWGEIPGEEMTRIMSQPLENAACWLKAEIMACHRPDDYSFIIIDGA